MLAAKRHGVKLWQVLGTGLDHVDVDFLRECGLAAANTPGLFSAIALAEHCMHLMLFLKKQHREAERNIAQGRRYAPLVNELNGQTLGLVGLGASGQELAKRAAAFGMRIVAIDVVAPTAQKIAELGVEYLGNGSQLESLLKQSDVVSLHVPMMPSTHNLLNRQTLRWMRSNALLINVARGGIVDEEALWVALKEGWIGGAGLDVFAHEPVDAHHRLLSLDNVVATPHIAGMTDGTSRRRGQAVVENLDRIAQGLPPLHQVC
jgi:D-3-phosphoglycerate dehydrogenase